MFWGYCAGMAKVRFIIGAAGLAIALTTAVMANAAIPGISTSIPEPSDFALFVMGVAGLIVGRRSSRRRHQSDDDTKA